MNRNHLTYKTSSEQLKYQYSKSEDPLGIGKTRFIWDSYRRQLILLMESDQQFSREVNALVKGDKLILEALFVTSYNKPFRTHLLGREIRGEVENGFLDIGFSEVKLKPGYQYTLVSCQVLEPTLLKVILDYKSLGSNLNN